MTCYNPQHIYIYRCNDEFNKVSFVDHGFLWHFEGNTFVKIDDCDIPCNKCIGCRLDYSKKWATRLVVENNICRNVLGKDSYFLTLTYDDDHEPP